MHASRCGNHLSGAEGLVRDEQVDELTLASLQRALTHERGRADRVHLRIEPVDTDEVQQVFLPMLVTRSVMDAEAGRKLARELLSRQGIAPRALDLAFEALSRGGAAAGENMRGAMLVDVHSGRRLEPDTRRGVRVSRMDLGDGSRQTVLQRLEKFGKASLRIREAMVLAAKVQAAPSVVAELCWSDDPSYVTGYVSSRELGYVRITRLKEFGDPLGGRVFFVDSGHAHFPQLISYLERAAVLVEVPPTTEHNVLKDAP